MKAKVHLGYMLILFTIWICGLTGCVPALEEVELDAPERVVTVSASRIPTGIPSSLALATPTPSPQSQSRFIYVIEAYPPENSLVSLSEYNSKENLLYESQSVCVEVYIRSIIQSGGDLSYDTVVDHINLQVDSVERPLIQIIEIEELAQNGIETEGTRTYLDSSSPSIICWQAELEEGDHQATFQVRQVDGNLLSYSWYFTLIPDE